MYNEKSNQRIKVSCANDKPNIKKLSKIASEKLNQRIKIACANDPSHIKKLSDNTDL
ncbi:MAG: hypothetical protein ACE5R7_02430 [Nitrosarchaeum sp.]